MNKTILWTALVTPFDDKGVVDYDSLEVLLRKQEEAGNGILVLGSTGEGLALDHEEKKQIVAFVAGFSLSVPVMVGVGGFQLEEQIEFIRDCNQCPIDAYLLVTPLYAKPGLEGQTEWFTRLMEATNRPCMIYNVPSRTGVKLRPEVPARLADKFDHVLGVKEASGSVDEFKEFRQHAPSVDFYSGDDGLTPAFAKEGAVGLVSVASNVWPKATHRYVEHCLEGNTDDLFPLWKDATDQLFNGPNPVPAKALLHQKGWISTDNVRAPLHQGDLGSMEKLIEADQAISNWYNS